MRSGSSHDCGRRRQAPLWFIRKHRPKARRSLRSKQGQQSRMRSQKNRLAYMTVVGLPILPGARPLAAGCRLSHTLARAKMSIGSTTANIAGAPRPNRGL